MEKEFNAFLPVNCLALKIKGKQIINTFPLKQDSDTNLLKP